jgi:hypothetical protein
MTILPQQLISTLTSKGVGRLRLKTWWGISERERFGDHNT